MDKCTLFFAGVKNGTENIMSDNDGKNSADKMVPKIA